MVCPGRHLRATHAQPLVVRSPLSRAAVPLEHCEQSRRKEWFLKVCNDLVLDSRIDRLCRNDANWKISKGMACTQPTQEFPAVHAGHLQVEQHDVRTHATQQGERLDAVRRFEDAVTA